MRRCGCGEVGVGYGHIRVAVVVEVNVEGVDGRGHGVEARHQAGRTANGGFHGGRTGRRLLVAVVIVAPQQSAASASAWVSAAATRNGHVLEQPEARESSGAAGRESSGSVE